MLHNWKNKKGHGNTRHQLSRNKQICKQKRIDLTVQKSSFLKIIKEKTVQSRTIRADKCIWQKKNIFGQSCLLEEPFSKDQ